MAYLPSDYVTPQIYQDPNNSALVTPPNGWGIVPAPAAQPAQRRGMGLFDSADWTTWGWGEWLTILAGAYFLWNIMSDVGKGASTVKRTVRRRRSKAARRKKLEEEMSLL